MTSATTVDVRWSRALGAYAGLAVATAVLLRAGGGSLSLPLGSGEDLAAWLEATSPAVVAMALVRLLALGACGYLAVALTAAVVAGLSPRGRLALLVGQLAPATIRRAVVYGARSGLATTMALGWLTPLTTTPAGATPAATRAPVPDDPSSHTATMSKLDATMVHLPPGSGSTGQQGDQDATPGTATTAPAAAPSPTPPARSAPAPGPTRPAPPRPSTSTSAPAAGTVVPNPSRTTDESADGVAGPVAPGSSTSGGGAGASGDDEWVVGPGESFWSIAEEALRDARGGTPPDDADVSRYWRRLIAANQHRLPAADNPDLLLVGQVLILPPPS